MRASGKPGMTDAQIADFVARFQPAYKAYLQGLYEHVSESTLTAWHGLAGMTGQCLGVAGSQQL